MIKSKNTNPKIPYPPIIEGYISSRMLREIFIDHISRDSILPTKQIDNNVRSAILRLKIFLKKYHPEKGILREGERGKEQFLTIGIIGWLKKRNCALKNINLENFDGNKI